MSTPLLSTRCVRFLFIFSLIAIPGFCQSTVTLKRPDGSSWTGSISTEPLYVDATNIGWLKDPDGDGPGSAVRAKMTNPAWAALVKTTQRSYHQNASSTDSMKAALGFYMDHNASFSKGSGDYRACTAAMLANEALDPGKDCYKWYLVDLFRNWGKYTPKSGSCWVASENNCAYVNANSGLTDYTGDHIREWAFAYSVIRPYLTASERTLASSMLVNGIAPDPASGQCDNRVPDRPLSGYYTWTYTGASSQCGSTINAIWYGPELDRNLIGKWVWVMPEWGKASFTNQTSVSIPFPGRTGGVHSCWDASGALLATSGATYASGQTTVTFSAARTGTCATYTGSSSTNGEFNEIVSIGAYNAATQTQTFTFKGYCRQNPGGQMRNVLMPLKDLTVNTCGIGSMTQWHDNAPTYTSYNYASKLAAAVKVSDSTIQVTNASGFPRTPFFLGLNTYIDYEVVRVTAVTGNTLTVERGVQNTMPRPWASGKAVRALHSGGEDADGTNNRVMTKHDGHWMIALSTAHDSAYSRNLLIPALATYWLERSYRPILPYLGSLVSTSMTSYDLSRIGHHLPSVIQTLLAASSGAVDYRGEWMKTTMGSRYYYNTYPWNRKSHWLHGIQNSCKALTGSSTEQCYEPLLYLGHFYRGSEDVAYGRFLAKQENGVLGTESGYTAGGPRLITTSLLFEKGDETEIDYRLFLPPHKIAVSQASATSPTANYNVAVSRTDWSATATQTILLAPDGIGDKFLGGPPRGHYMIGKRGDFFIGQDGGMPFCWLAPMSCASVDAFTARQNGVFFYGSNGLRVDAAPAPADQNFSKTIATPDTIYVRVSQTPGTGYNTSFLGFDLVRWHRHFAHFKPAGGAEHVVVYDDAAITSDATLLLQIPYNNNGQTGTLSSTTSLTEGLTYLESGTRLVSNSYQGNQKLFTDVVRSGDYISDLNVTQDSVTRIITVGKGCSTAAPCRLKTSYGTFTYTSEQTITLPSLAGNARWFVYAHPGDGTLHVARGTTAPAPVCSAGISCDSTAVSTWPANSVRLFAIRANSAGSSLLACPSNPSSSAATYDLHCGAEESRRLFSGYINAARTGEFMVVHHVKASTESADPTAELSVIDSKHIGVQIGGLSPKVAIFGKAGAESESVSFTTTHTGNAQYLVTGLATGRYRIERNSTVLVSEAEVSSETGGLTFTAQAGSFAILRDGALAPVEVLTSSLPSVTLGQSYSAWLAASGGTGNYIWTLASGVLPPGLTMTPGTGQISGVPLVPGQFSFTVRAISGSQPGTRTLSIRVEHVAPTLVISTAELPVAVEEADYHSTISASGGEPPYQWQLSGTSNLPDGIGFDVDTGELVGTPLETGEFFVDVLLTDSKGDVASASLGLRVLTSLPSDALTVIPLSGNALFSYGRRGLAANDACTIKIFLASGELVSEAADGGGAGRRAKEVRDLLPNTGYRAVLQCGNQGAVTMITTKPATAPGTVSFPLEIAPPKRPDVVAARIEYGTSPTALTSSTKIACVVNCRTNLNVPSDSVLYWRIQWLGAADQVLAVSSVRPLAIQ